MPVRMLGVASPANGGRSRPAKLTGKLAKPAWLTPTAVARLVFPGVRTVVDGNRALAAYWQAQNAVAAKADGPLWLALGDSTVVGTGATHWRHTAIARVHAHLRAVSGEDWRVINLGVYGAKIDAVIETQLPALDAFGPPALLSVGAGANDVLWSRGLPRLMDAVGRLVDRLPSGTVIGTLPAGYKGKGLHANAWLRAEAAQRGLRVAEVGVIPDGTSMVAPDRFHPNDAGYSFIARGLAAALDLEVPPPDEAGL